MLKLRLALVNAFTEEEYPVECDLESTWVRTEELKSEIVNRVTDLVEELNRKHLR